MGDQAFYIPATELRLHPGWFPGDRALIESQARLTVIDESLAAASRASGATLPDLFLLLYGLTLVAVATGAWSLARALGATPWTASAFVLLLSLRHRIAKTGANTLEGYMHPRMLAFGVGLFVLAAVLRRRWPSAMLLWVVAAAIHPTTALWFAAAATGVAAAPWIVRHAPPLAVALSLIALAGGTWLAGPLAHLPVPPALRMDDSWSAVFADKDYLFASTWPAYAWVLNLAYLPLLIVLHRLRRAAGEARPADDGLLAGMVVLLALFAGAVWATEARLALAVQLQVSRVFWLMDTVSVFYVAWWLTARPKLAGTTRRLAITLVVVAAAGRGAYTLATAPDDRTFARRDLAPSAWTDAMAWLRQQPSEWTILAHPDHAWRYGTSVRVAAGRDVVVESVKDTAIAMYDRATAMRVTERLASLAAFDTLTADGAKALGARWGADVLITGRPTALPLPVLFANDGFVVYDLR